MEILFGIIILILSIVVHEISHGYAADYLGDPTARLAGRLTLNPIKHIHPVGSIIIPLLTWFGGGFIFGWAKPVPVNPYNLRDQKWGEALVALAGPASNILLAAIFGTILRFNLLSGAPATGLLSFVVLINLVLAVFNLVPIPPLDGSRVLFALLPYKYLHIRAKLERWGMLLILLFIFFLWRLLIPIVGYLFTILTGLSF